MRQYLDIVQKVLDIGVTKEDRTGTGTRSVAGCFFEHDMSEGFPLLTTKRVPFNLVASELEFFIHGMTDKKWLQDRNNYIWDEWCSGDKIAYGTDDYTKQKMLIERELGPLYGWQWRNFGGRYKDHNSQPVMAGIDQFQNMINMLMNNPEDRRMIVMAWNPMDNYRMALPPCHYAFQVTVTGGKLNLMWNQRSVDTALGLPFNIASYGLLLHLIAKEVGLEEGRLCGFLADTHLYLNHIDKISSVQLPREPLPLCLIKTDDWGGIYDWTATDTTVDNYEHHKGIKFDIAV